MKPINWVFSFLFGIVAFVLLLFVAVALTFNLWFPTVAPWLLRNQSDFALSIGKSQSNVFTMNFHFRDVGIRNGDAYPVPQFVDIDRFRADLLLLSLATKKVVVENFTLHVPRITYVKNGEGKSNLSEFLSEISGGGSRGEKAEGRKSPRRVFFQNFDLRIGRVVLMDYGANPVRVQEIPLDYSIQLSNMDADALLRRVTNDLKAEGASFLMHSVLNSLVQMPGFSSTIAPVMKATGVVREDIRSSGRNFLQKLRAKFK
jgi:hypothetical protein